MTQRRLGLALMASALAGGAALAAPRTYDLPDPTAQLRPPKDRAQQPGFEAAQANCQVCHSVDYIAMQPPGKGRAFWESEVTKMVTVYHAPVAEADAKAIAAYLADTY
ncbi:SorB family sulfite dehydrogenase c-type cytochrome subunit [Methylobacterium planeticum]|uniref:Cytochrome c n=1 Tax=Methylobacterium planeticum TaxID=2615211 RepID=A0A6N6MX22_9HYPH|nr:cytochrome c [Methylobacterium planeticum]KAB1074440.1 cytochrome c [Methylobacterium planeticum]